MPPVGTTRERGSSVSSDVSEPLGKIGEVIEGLAAKNATMKDGAPEAGGGGGGDGRAPTTTEERVAAYDKYKKDIGKAFDKNTRADGSIDASGLALDVGQAVVDLGVAAGPEVFQLFSDLIGKAAPN